METRIKTYGKAGLLTRLMRKFTQHKGWGECYIELPVGTDSSEEEI